MGKYKLINKFTLISSLFIILILTTGMSNQNNSFSGKIFKNIYIEQVHVGKMKLDEAKEAVDKKYLLKPIYMKYKDKTWCINPQDIDLSYNTDDAVKNAYSYTRSDSNIENIKRKCNLDLNKPYKIKLNATYNEVKLSEQLSYIQNDINKKVQQATLEISDSGTDDNNSIKGRIRSRHCFLKRANIRYDLKNKDIKDIKLPVKIIKPTITTEQVKSINTILGQFSTSFNENSARGSNIYVAGKSTSDILIMPGDTFFI